MESLDGFKVAIAGLGLMGGSLAMALKQSGTGCNVFGADANPSTVERAQQLGVIDHVCTEFAAMDLIVLAMPVRGIIDWLRSCGRSLPERCVIMDIGSTKRDVVAAMNTLTAQCIGGHPMAGKETAGLEAADGELFRGARFVLTPTERTTKRAMEVSRAVVSAVGANLIVLDAEAHDRAVAAISHVPYLLSVGLVNAVDGLNDEHALQLASSGYRGMTRLAASDLRMWSDIVATNRAAIIEMLDCCQREIEAMRTAIAMGEEATWQRLMETAFEAKRRA